MTADIKLLPLPEPNYKWMGYTTREAEAIARANVARATAPLQAEIEALRAKLREAWSAVDSKAGWEWKKRAEQAEVQAKRLADAIRAVVADMREWGEPAKGAHVERIQRRLDDALRDHDQEVGND